MNKILEDDCVNELIIRLCKGELICVNITILEHILNKMDSINTIMIQKSGLKYYCKADDITINRYKIANREQYYSNCIYYKAIETDYDIYGGHSHYESYCNFDNKNKKIIGCEERICKKCENFVDNGINV